MELRSVIKKNARRALSGFWGQAIAIALLVIGCQLLLLIAETLLMHFLDVPTYIDVNGTPDNPFDDMPNISPASFLLLGGGWLLSLLIGMPLTYGVRRWFYIRSGGHHLDFGDVFFYFESLRSYLKCLWIELCTGLRRLLWCAAFLLPGITCTLLGKWAVRFASTDGERMLADGLTISGMIIWICGGILLIIFLQRYALTRYVFFEYRDIAAGQAIQLSIIGSRRYRIQMSIFCLSFAGWFLLCLLGIPLLFVLPYFLMAHSIYARLLIHESDLSGQLDEMYREQERKWAENRDPESQWMGRGNPE